MLGKTILELYMRSTQDNINVVCWEGIPTNSILIYHNNMIGYYISKTTLYVCVYDKNISYRCRGHWY